MSTDTLVAAAALLDSIPQNGETVVTTPVIEQEPVLEDAAAKAKDDPQFIHMPFTVNGEYVPELLAAARKAAGDMALGPWLQGYLAKQLGVTLPVKTDARKRYNTDAEREQAKLTSRERSANLHKGLLAQHRAKTALKAATNDAERAAAQAKLADAEKLIAANS